MAEHTPGPWEVTHIYPDNDQKYYDWSGQVISKGPYICTIKQAGTREETEAMANMHLIAAAPDLLAALEGILNAYVPGWDEEEYSDIGGATRQARAAIAKARGTEGA